MKETVNLKSGKSINVDPLLLIESFGDVSKMVDGNVMILEAVRDTIQRGEKFGLSRSEAAGFALEMHRRAGEKAREAVHVNMEEMGKNEEEETKDSTEAPAET